MPVIFIHRVLVSLLRSLIKPTRNKIVVAATIVAVIAVVNAGLFYYFEKPAWEAEGQELSFTRALYWSIITMATVGYGDVVPKTGPGMAVAVVNAILGIASYSLLVSLIAEQLLSSTMRKTWGLAWLKNRDVVIIGDSEECIEAMDEIKKNIPHAKISWITDKQPNITVDVDYVVGNLVDTETMRRGGVDRAKYIIVCPRDDSIGVHIALLARKLNPSARIIPLARTSKTAEVLEAAGFQYVVPSTITARILASMVFEKNVALLISDLTTVKGVGDLVEKPADKYAGLTIEEALVKAKREEDVIIVGIAKPSGEIIVNPPLNYKISANDKLIVVKGSGTLTKIV